MGKSKTHEEFVEEVNGLVGDEYLIVGTYATAKTKIEIKHIACGLLYKATPDRFIQGRRCPVCSKRRSNNSIISGAEFKKELKAHVGDEYSVVGDYLGWSTKIKIKHSVCGYVYEIAPKTFMRGVRCAKCISRGTLKTNDEFTRDVKELVGDEYTVVGIYLNTKTKIEMKHNICGTLYEVRPNSFLDNGCRCPTCKESKGEKAVAAFLNANNIEHETQYLIHYSKGKPPLKLDFYVQGVAIEYDGEFHYKPIRHAGGEEGLRAQQKRDRIKDEYCGDNGIPLIRIPYWDYANIDAILTKKLLPILADTKRTI